MGDKVLLGDSMVQGKRKFRSYKEVQIHGEVRFDSHVYQLVAHQRHRDSDKEQRIHTVCEQHGWQFAWVDQHGQEMLSENMHQTLLHTDHIARLRASEHMHRTSSRTDPTELLASPLGLDNDECF